MREQVEQRSGRVVTPAVERLFLDWSTELPPAQRRLVERLQELLPDGPAT